MCFNFFEIWHLEQIEHSNYEYIVLGIDYVEQKL